MQRMVPETADAQQAHSQTMLAALNEEGRHTPLDLELQSIQAIAEQTLDYLLVPDQVEPALME